ncbi:MAG: O-antigen ligase family protein [Pseudobutyrivibrio sp.]|nr:O-antigen ligase family protein [Pseudobutyrivibrio sp.]
METIYKNKKLIAMFLVAATIFARCDLGLALGKQYVLANLAAAALSAVFCLILMIKDKATAKEALFNPAIIWVVAFSILVFIYGHFKLGVCSDMYSRQYHILTVVPAVFIMIMLYYNMDDVLDIISVAACAVIPLTLVTSLLFDPVWLQLFDGNAYRVGATPAGTCVDTGNLMLIMLIPLMYQIIINRKFKAYLWAALLAVAQIVASGSKSSVLPIVLVIAILLLGSAKDKKTLRRSIIILLILGVAGVAAIMLVPALYSIIGERIVEMFTGIGSTDYDLHTSTGQRMAVIAAVKEHFVEHPLFGHGFYAFKEMPYSLLEEYRPNDGVEIAYRHIHTHMNFLELLFSFGIFGFVMYYWFPVYLAIKSFFTKNKMAKLLVLSFLVSFVFMDLGIDMFYKYMTPYYTYLVAYVFLKKKEN